MAEAYQQFPTVTYGIDPKSLYVSYVDELAEKAVAIAE
ncbi:hypothetical protein SBA6_170004 [Candidatus Sulfopaludibacter sp. SbA6]|nr:hypothetical protein SBA6_170004 [Candidatus Sulfopaludibacter sp. SbA6]